MSYNTVKTETTQITSPPWDSSEQPWTPWEWYGQGLAQSIPGLALPINSPWASTGHAQIHVQARTLPRLVRTGQTGLKLINKIYVFLWSACTRNQFSFFSKRLNLNEHSLSGVIIYKMYWSCSIAQSTYPSLIHIQQCSAFGTKMQCQACIYCVLQKLFYLLQVASKNHAYVAGYCER